MFKPPLFNSREEFLLRSCWMATAGKVRYQSLFDHRFRVLESSSQVWCCARETSVYAEHLWMNHEHFDGFFCVLRDFVNNLSIVR